MPTNDNLFCTWRAQPYDIHLRERFLFFLCLFASFFLFCYLHFLVLFLVFWFISIFPSALCCPHFSIRIFPSASAIRRYPVRVLQTPAPASSIWTHLKFFLGSAIWTWTYLKIFFYLKLILKETLFAPKFDSSMENAYWLITWQVKETLHYVN